MYDLIIIGGGPGGIAAGIYASRKKLNAAIIADSFGGQSVVSADIQNWIGTKSLSGLSLADALESHLRSQGGIEIIDGDRVTSVVSLREMSRRDKKTADGFKITTKNGKIMESKTVLATSGSRHRRLGIPGEDRLDGKGVVWCATCDAPLFGGKDVAVIGAGNAGLESVRDCLPYASKVYLLVRGESIKGDAQTFEEIKKNPKVEIIYQAEAQEILGDAFVSGLKYLDKKDNSTKELKVDGVFVEIGAIPNSDFLGTLVDKNEFGAVRTDRFQRTSLPGIWAAGDVCDFPYRQNNISAGDAIKAVLDINDYLSRNKK